MIACTSLRAQWTRTPLPAGITGNCFAVRGDTLFAGTSSRLYRSLDYGDSWVQTSAGMGNGHNVHRLASSGPYMFAGTNRFVHRSTDNGANWLQYMSGLTSAEIYALTVQDTTVYAGLYRGIFRSTDRGVHWTAAGFPQSIVHDLAVAGDALVAATDGGVFRSTDDGMSWEAIDSGLTAMTDYDVYLLAMKGTTIFAGTKDHPTSSYKGNVFRSTDHGESWTMLQPRTLSRPVRALAVDGDDVYVSTHDGTFHSSDNGDTWTPLGPWGFVAYSLAVHGDYLFAGVYSQGVWRHPRPGVSLKAPPVQSDAPQQMMVSPNPVSKFGMLHYSLNNHATVNITLHDALGRIVAAPITNDFQQGGSHSILINTDTLEPGLYSCILNAGGVRQLTKLIVVR